MDKKDKRKKILKVSGLIGLFLLVFGLSYALFTVTLNGTKKVKIKTGKLELQLLDKNNNPIYITDQNSTSSYEINLDNQVPVSDELGLDSTAFEFKLKNTGNLKASYTIYLDDVALETGESRIDDEYIRYSLTKNGSEENPQELSSRELDKGAIEANNTTNTYTLKIWIAEDATNAAMDKVFNATLRVEGTQYVQTGLFEEGTFAKTLYDAGTVGEYNAMTAKVPNGFDSTKEESGLYKYTDEDGTTTYAYRGTDVDNYVTFAGQTWRILRIQEDGTIKLITENALQYENEEYDSRGYYSPNTESYTRVAYNKIGSSENDSKYSTSNIKGYVDAWYNDTMMDYDSKIATNEYCSDRTEDHNSLIYQMSGYSASYGINNRLDLGSWDGTTELTEEIAASFTWSPSVSCVTEKINAKAALITKDEQVLAGGGLMDNTSYYLYKSGYGAWTMSPDYFDTGSVVFKIRGEDYVTNSYAVLPVITLKANITASSGDGSSEHPYVID